MSSLDQTEEEIRQERKKAADELEAEAVKVKASNDFIDAEKINIKKSEQKIDALMSIMSACDAKLAAKLDPEQPEVCICIHM